MSIKRILVTQPSPTSHKSPYFELASKNNLKIDFIPFTEIVEIGAKEFRKQKINISEHTAIIFNSKAAIDHFYRMCQEVRFSVPNTIKYFCLTEVLSFYLQKYIIYRKRKVFFGQGKVTDMEEEVLKYKDENFLIPLPELHSLDIPNYLSKNKIKYTKAILYRTVNNNLSDLAIVDYDILVFYSPLGIKSLLESHPNFIQNTVKIAAFGSSTIKAVKENGFRLDIEAPVPQSPSMTMALNKFIQKTNNP